MEIFFIAGTFGCLIFNVVILIFIHDSIKQFQKITQDNFDDLKRVNKRIRKGEL